MHFERVFISLLRNTLKKLAEWVVKSEAALI